MVNALAALAHEKRLAAYRLLVAAGPQGRAAGAIAEALDIPAPTLSFHLAQLSQADLVRSRQEGRYIYYSADFERMNELLGFLTENCCQGSAASCSVPRCALPDRPRATVRVPAAARRRR